MLFILSSRFLPTSFSLLVTFTPLTHSFALYFKYHSNKPSFLILYFLIFFFICFFVYVTFSPTLFLINYVFSLLHTLFRFSLLFFLLYHSSFFSYSLYHSSLPPTPYSTLTFFLLSIPIPFVLLSTPHSLSSYSLPNSSFLTTSSLFLFPTLYNTLHFLRLSIPFSFSSYSLFLSSYSVSQSSFLPNLSHSLLFFLFSLAFFLSFYSFPTLLSSYSLTLPFLLLPHSSFFSYSLPHPYFLLTLSPTHPENHFPLNHSASQIFFYILIPVCAMNSPLSHTLSLFLPFCQPYSSLLHLLFIFNVPFLFHSLYIA